MLSIVYEDAGLMVVNKPAGLVCHPTKGDVYSSLISRVRLYLGAPAPAPRETPPDAPLPTGPQPQLVNRLDRETSGLVLIAKHPAAARELRAIWERREVTKRYLAIVHGHVAADQGTIDAPLGKDEQSRVVIKDTVRPDGAPASTNFQVLRRFTRPLEASAPPPPSLNSQPSTLNYSLLQVLPLTGRKHQIRIHLAHLGHPLVGDKLYGGDEDLYLAFVERRLTPDQRQRLILPYHALHAAEITFQWRGAERAFSATPEAWFEEMLRTEWSNGVWE